MKLFIQEGKNLQVLLSSALIFIVCFVCLTLLDKNNLAQNGSSRILPLVLNTAEPYLVTGNIDRLKIELEQLISGSSLEQVDVHGADSSLLVSVRNLNLDRLPDSTMQEYSAAIVLDDALAATIVIQENQSAPAQSNWPNLLISFACALAAAIAGLFLNTLVFPSNSRQPNENIADFETGENEAEPSSNSELQLPINTDPMGHQRMVLMIRLSDLKDQLIRTDQTEDYMTRVWRITELMADTYGISCIGVQSGMLVFTASSSNSSVALRYCIMFGWNLSR